MNRAQEEINPIHNIRKGTEIAQVRVDPVEVEEIQNKK